MSKPEAFIDLYTLEEDQRIEAIGHFVMSHNKTAAVITDSEPGKAERYIKKLTERFPGIVILERLSGPVANTVSIRVGPPNSTK